MKYNALKAELINDPLARVYGGMTDQQVVDSLNTKDRSRNRSSLTGSQVLNAVDAAEWAALTDAKRRTAWDVVHMGTINPFGIEQTLFVGVFGGGSATISALSEAREEAISRATEIGLRTVKEVHVQRVRA